MTLREFVRRETEALGRFLEPAGEHLVGWRREYRCEACGFRCHTPHDIYGHRCAGHPEAEP